MDKKEIDKVNKSNTIVYTITWNPVKSLRLKRIRGVSFDELTADGSIIDIIDHPVRLGQHMIIFKFKKYIWITPCVIEEGCAFLKTLYPSRKYRKIYKEGVVDEKN